MTAIEKQLPELISKMFDNPVSAWGDHHKLTDAEKGAVIEGFVEDIVHYEGFKDTVDSYDQEVDILTTAINQDGIRYIGTESSQRTLDEERESIRELKVLLFDERTLRYLNAYFGGFHYTLAEIQYRMDEFTERAQQMIKTSSKPEIWMAEEGRLGPAELVPLEDEGAFRRNLDAYDRREHLLNTPNLVVPESLTEFHKRLELQAEQDPDHIDMNEVQRYIDNNLNDFRPWTKEQIQEFFQATIDFGKTLHERNLYIAGRILRLNLEIINKQREPGNILLDYGDEHSEVLRQLLLSRGVPMKNIQVIHLIQPEIIPSTAPATQTSSDAGKIQWQAQTAKSLVENFRKTGNTDLIPVINQKLGELGFQGQLNLLDSFQRKEGLGKIDQFFADVANKGGIDLNSANLKLQIKRDGRGVPLPLAQQDMVRLSQIEGFVPEIIEIKPAGSLPIVGELQKLRSSSV
jgi:hypothetical protein